MLMILPEEAEKNREYRKEWKAGFVYKNKGFAGKEDKRTSWQDCLPGALNPA
jgi:hypothetical protein